MTLLNPKKSPFDAVFTALKAFSIDIFRNARVNDSSLEQFENTESNPAANEAPEPVLIADEAQRSQNRLEISPETMYSEAFEMLRKYADMAVDMRKAVFVQGILILSGAGFLLVQGYFLWASMVSAFCLASTLILNVLHVHYNNYFFSVRTFIQKLENKYSDPDFDGYVVSVEEIRDKRVATPFVGWLRNFGSFFLLGATSILMIGLTFFAWLYEDGIDPRLLKPIGTTIQNQTQAIVNPSSGAPIDKFEAKGIKSPETRSTSAEAETKELGADDKAGQTNH